jgi:hypothetical protein
MPIVKMGPTVTAILSDFDVQGQLNKLVHFLRDGEWRDFWIDAQVTLASVADFGLKPTDSDARIWEVCQAAELVLVTANRNDDGPDSLEATLREKNSVRSLPVFTLVDPKRIMSNRAYAERVALRMLEYLLDLQKLRGTGRLFLP